MESKGLRKGSTRIIGRLRKGTQWRREKRERLRGLMEMEGES